MVGTLSVTANMLGPEYVSFAAQLPPSPEHTPPFDAQGESVGMVLHMVGAVPVKEGTGRIARYELLPLDKMNGRPRVDVLCNMSGIFRSAALPPPHTLPVPGLVAHGKCH
jgi:hypothetical protein